jgi:hypothetical protein
LFHLVAGMRYIKRNPGPWSEDFSPDVKAWPRAYYAWTYGSSMGGGYFYSYSHLPLWLMAQHSPVRAQAAINAALDDFGLDTQAPYETAQFGVPNGTNYLQAAVSFLGLVRTTSLLQVKTRDSNPLNLYHLVGGEWTLFQ